MRSLRPCPRAALPTWLSARVTHRTRNSERIYKSTEKQFSLYDKEQYLPQDTHESAFKAPKALLCSCTALSLVSELSRRGCSRTLALTGCSCHSGTFFFPNCDESALQRPFRTGNTVRHVWKNSAACRFLATEMYLLRLEPSYLLTP